MQAERAEIVALLKKFKVGQDEKELKGKEEKKKAELRQYSIDGCVRHDAVTKQEKFVVKVSKEGYVKPSPWDSEVLVLSDGGFEFNGTCAFAVHAPHQPRCTPIQGTILCLDQPITAGVDRFKFFLSTELYICFYDEEHQPTKLVISCPVTGLPINGIGTGTWTKLSADAA